jgi:anti-sigma B factor antagonist/stage II sporulation protein AA (anti-sigma F factor antagonist)
MGTVEGTMEIKEDRKGDVLIVTINGRLDAISSPTAEKHIFELINKGSHKIILELGGVDYLSSAGMRMLLSTTKKLKGISGKIVLCGVTQNVMDVLKMSGFDHVLAIVKSKDEALRHF